MRNPSKTELDHIKICECFHAGLNLTETSQYMGKRITGARRAQALAWEEEQQVVRSEIQNLYRAYKHTQQLKSELHLAMTAVAVIESQVSMRDLSSLIDKEIEYANRIRELSQSVVEAGGYADIAALPEGIFTEDLEGFENDDS